MWNSVQTNKIVGGMWPNDADGNAWSNPSDGFPAVLPAAGYKVVDPGGYQDGTEDFTSKSPSIKNAGVRDPHRCAGTARLRQHVEADAPAGLQAPGGHGRQGAPVPAGRGSAWVSWGTWLSTEVWWTPRHPFKSSLTGETCQQFADDFETRTGLQWTQPLLHYGVFEVVVDALKRCTNIDDKQKIVDAISTHQDGDSRRSDRLHLAGRRRTPCIRSRTCTALPWSAGSGSKGPASTRSN